MEWFREKQRAYGLRDPVIPRDVPLDEVKEALESRLISRFTVAAGHENGCLDIHDAGRPGADPRLVATIKVAAPAAGCTNIVVERTSDSVWVRSYARRFRRMLRSAPELRTGPIPRIAYQDGQLPDSAVSLLGAYAGQFGSYTTLLWQVPALGLTAQAFLLTIALMNTTTSGARIIACALSMIIAIASGFLMHNQRGRAVNHAELLRRLSAKLELGKFLEGPLELDDAVPSRTSAQNIWAVDHLIYHGWILCMELFFAADVLIILAVGLRPSLLRLP